MTNKEELKNKFRKITETKWQRGVVIERMLSNDDLDTVFDFFWNEIEQIRKSDMERVKKVLDRHVNWQPTEGFESEEEKGYQKGLIAEAKLIRSEVLSIIKQDEN